MQSQDLSNNKSVDAVHSHVLNFEPPQENVATKLINHFHYHFAMSTTVVKLKIMIRENAAFSETANKTATGEWMAA